LPTALACPVELEVDAGSRPGFVYGTVTPSGPAFQRVRLPARFLTAAARHRTRSHRLPTPTAQRRWACHAVGLGSSRFARHYYGTDLSSSGYLDVSIPRVPPSNLLIQSGVTGGCPAGLPYSEIPASNGCWPLLLAFRSLPRPSSVTVP